MSERYTYLTDEELEQLIADVEINDLVSAPPDLAEDICAEIERPPAKVVHNKKKEFQQYCFRVITSVAAAILLIFIMPKVSEMNLKFSEVMQETTGPEKSHVSLRYATKEEALNDTGFFGKVFGGNNLFGSDLDGRIFK